MSTEIDTELAVLLDVGSAWAKASIIGRVRGRWRLVTHVAQPTAWGAAELRTAILERMTRAVDPRLAGRLPDLLASANRIECHTARRPGRLAVVAVSRELSGSAARRAAEAAGWQIVEHVTLDDGRSLADRLARLQAVETDAWLVAGGFDGVRSPRAMEAAALVASARRRGGAPVVWAGSDVLAEDVRDLFEPDTVGTVANPRPDARRDDAAPLRDHLQRLLRSVVAREDETHLSAIAMPRAVGVLAAGSGLRVLAVDIGARTGISALAEPDGQVVSRIHGGGGLSGLGAVPGAASRVSRLAGDAGDEAAVADLLQTLRARPASLPLTVEELSATHVAARVQLAALLEDASLGPLDLVIGAGATISCAPTPAQSARILVEGVRPLGVTQLAIDPAALLGPLGSLPDDEIGEGTALLAEDLLVPLGTSVVCRGGDPGRVAMRITVHRPGWPPIAPIELRTGQLQVVPLGRGQEAELTIEPGDGVSLGATRRSPRIQARATGGAVGLILDARGVPIVLPKRGDDRRAVQAGWRDTLGREGPPGVERVA
ncbi:MAG TPA: glutamate mutase L [Candidatus Limnocylindria bacterium]